VTIHYHGTPITPRVELLAMAGCHFCVSVARPDDLDVVLRVGQSVLFDNGAFSLFKRGGGQLDVMNYYRWLEPILQHPHWAVIPDVIDGDIEQQRAFTHTWPFWQLLGAPVWHLGLPIDWLVELSDHWPRVCLGSSGAYWEIGSPKWCARMDEAFNALSRRRIRLPWMHGLRMLGQVDGPWPLASADSTNVGQNFKRDTGCANCKAKRIDAAQAPRTWKLIETQSRIFE